MSNTYIDGDKPAGGDASDGGVKTPDFDGDLVFCPGCKARLLEKNKNLPGVHDADAFFDFIKKCGTVKNEKDAFWKSLGIDIYNLPPEKADLDEAL